MWFVLVGTPCDLSLASHRLRLERAEHRLHYLAQEIRLWLNVHKALPETKFDPEAAVTLDLLERGRPGLVGYGTPHVFARFRVAARERVDVGYSFPTT